MSHSARYLSVLIAIAAVCGCSAFRGPDPTVELLEAELRWLEDNLYRLDDQLDQCHEQLESTRRNNAILRSELAQAKSMAAGTSAAQSETQKNDQVGRDFDELSDEELYDFKGPVVIMGDADEKPDPPVATDGEGTPGANELPDVEIRIEGIPSPQSIPEPEVDADDSASSPLESNEAKNGADRVTRIVLNRKLTGGYNFDGQSGHDGIMVVIEPQNAYAQYLPVPGAVTVELRDPQQLGLRGRVGKWKFDPVESAAFLKKTAMGRGIHLQLPWPAAPPQREQFVLSVVYETPDGRKLRKEKNISIQPTVSALASKADEAERQPWSPDRPTSTASSSKWRAGR